MADIPTYDADLVDKIKELTRKRTPPAQIVSKKMVDADAQTVMAVLRDANQHGWDNIRAVSALDGFDDDEDEAADPASEDDYEDEDDVHTFGTPEADAGVNLPPDIALEQANAIEEQIADRRKRPMRGHKPPARQDAKLANKTRRRRRGGDPMYANRRLLADMQKLNPEFEYRWFLDRPGRQMEKTILDDWDIVDDAHLLAGEGGAVTAIAGRNDYRADKMVLMRKLKIYQREDDREKLDRLAEFDQQLMGGQVGEGGQSLVNSLGPKEVLEGIQKGSLDKTNTYVPAGERNVIGAVSESL